jgi:hypothetical protein
MFRYSDVTHPMKSRVAAAESCRGVTAFATPSSYSARSAKREPYTLVGSIEHASSAVSSEQCESALQVNFEGVQARPPSRGRDSYIPYSALAIAILVLPR